MEPICFVFVFKSVFISGKKFIIWLKYPISIFYPIFSNHCPAPLCTYPPAFPFPPAHSSTLLRFFRYAQRARPLPRSSSALSLVETDWAAVAAALRPGLLRPLSRDEHHQVRPLSGLPFLMCATEHPNPSLLFVFGSDLLTSVYACIMPTNFDCCAKIIGCTCLHPMSLPGQLLSLLAAYYCLFVQQFK